MRRWEPAVLLTAKMNVISGWLPLLMLGVRRHCALMKMRTENNRAVNRRLILLGALVVWVALVLVIVFGLQTQPRTTSPRSGTVRLPQVGDQVRIVGRRSAVYSATVISVGTPLEHIGPRLLRSREQPNPLAVRPPAVDAEPFNVEAMRRYQERWDIYRSGSRGAAPPTLYPSPVERILETHQ